MPIIGEEGHVRTFISKTEVERVESSNKGDRAIKEFHSMVNEFVRTFSGGETDTTQFSPGEFATMAEVLKKLTPEIAEASPEKAGEFLLFIKNMIDSWSKLLEFPDGAQYAQPLTLLKKAYGDLVASRNEFNTRYWSDRADTITKG